MQIMNEIEALHDRVSCAIYGGMQYNHSKKSPWSVSMTYTHDGVKAEINESGPDFEAMMERAWNRMNGMILHGLGAGAMTPAIEHKPLARTRPQNKD
jgi:hypothetical protein